MERKACLVIFLCALVSSCDNYQYKLDNTNGYTDPNQMKHEPAPTSNPQIVNSATFNWTLPMFERDYYWSSINSAPSCNLNTANSSGTFTYQSRCDLKASNPGGDCISLFSLPLDTSKTSLPELSVGNWMIRISGSHKMRNFFHLQKADEYAYWIDSVEVYVPTEAGPKYLGSIQGEDWAQGNTNIMKTFVFERQIPSDVKLDSIKLRFSRRCKKSNFNYSEFEKLLNITTSNEASSLVIDHIEFVQTK